MSGAGFGASEVETTALSGEPLANQPSFASSFDLYHSKEVPVFSSCVVVGSSGSMSGKKQGDWIDAHDAVFRMNQAPTAGFQADVGRKTTVRVCNVHNYRTCGTALDEKLSLAVLKVERPRWRSAAQHPHSIERHPAMLYLQV
jgi:hypothetical protein